jgi:hypothetical protein
VFVPTYAYDPFAFGAAPFWWGWGWGYGYYPFYPRPEYEYPPELVQQLTARASLGGGATIQGGAFAGGSFGVEGERLGFHFGLDELHASNGFDSFSSRSRYTHASAHLTVAAVATDVGRLRLDFGGSYLSWPDAGPDAGVTAIGPDVGISGQLGLVGPVGIEGYARLSPYPVVALDALAALAFHAGGFAMTVGWRDLSIRRSGPISTPVGFSGPQIGFGAHL